MMMMMMEMVVHPAACYGGAVLYCLELNESCLTVGTTHKYYYNCLITEKKDGDAVDGNYIK